MAKKKELLSDGTSLPSVFDLVKKIDDSVEIIAESAYSNIQSWIPTGNYILNACMSGDLFKGVPSGRITTFEGDSGVGKSFLACSICREAQKMGYTPIYMDSEGAIDSNFVSRLGVDPTNLIIKQVSTIAETSQFIANICAQLQEQDDKYREHQKVIMVLDSLGNLTSDKERDDIMAGNNKRDMTKAQEIKAMFRVNATPLARLQIPLIVNNHVYACLSEDSEILMEDGTYKQIKNIEVGENVMTMAGPMPVNNKFIHQTKKYYELEFEDGFKIKCTFNHKFLVKTENNELIYKEACDLTVDDEIIINE